VSIYVEDIEVVHDGYQKALRKRLSGCDPIGCSAFGQYRYQWISGQLTRESEDQPVELSDAESEALETFLRSRLPGETRFSPPPEFLSSEAWRDLSARLQIRDLDALIVSADEVREHRSRKPSDSY
jgi:hypothetical protein